jgi:hypothetical protein
MISMFVEINYFEKKKRDVAKYLSQEKWRGC